MSTHKKTLNDLVNLGEMGRIGRSFDRKVSEIKFSDGTFYAAVDGSEGAVWHPRIKVEGKRTFGCTCPDHKKQRGAKGPCKHVIVLANTALEQLF